jgi:hypothetical protein
MREWNCAKCGIQFTTDKFRSCCPEHDTPINPAWGSAWVLDGKAVNDE